MRGRSPRVYALRAGPKAGPICIRRHLLPAYGLLHCQQSILLTHLQPPSTDAAHPDSSLTSGPATSSPLNSASEPSAPARVRQHQPFMLSFIPSGPPRGGPAIQPTTPSPHFLQYSSSTTSINQLKFHDTFTLHTQSFSTLSSPTQTSNRVPQDTRHVPFNYSCSQRIHRPLKQQTTTSGAPSAPTRQASAALQSKQPYPIQIAPRPSMRITRPHHSGVLRQHRAEGAPPPRPRQSPSQTQPASSNAGSVRITRQPLPAALFSCARSLSWLVSIPSCLPTLHRAGKPSILRWLRLQGECRPECRRHAQRINHAPGDGHMPLLIPFPPNPSASLCPSRHPLLSRHDGLHADADGKAQSPLLRSSLTAESRRQRRAAGAQPPSHFTSRHPSPVHLTI